MVGTEYTIPGGGDRPLVRVSGPPLFPPGAGFAVYGVDPGVGPSVAPGGDPGGYGGEPGGYDAGPGVGPGDDPWADPGVPVGGYAGPPAAPAPDPGFDLEEPDPDGVLLGHVAGGDATAFEALYDRCSGMVYGAVLQVLRDAAQAEEVMQEVMLEAWRSASRFDAARGSARAWLLTMSRRRAIDRVRSVQAAGDRDTRAAAAGSREYDEVSETVETRLEREQVRRCLGGLTPVQRESIDLAFYRGHSHREVSDLLSVPLGTVKTRLRDGLLRLRDCLGVGL